MKKIIFLCLLAIAACALMTGCEKTYYINHAYRPPIWYNHEYLTVAEVFCNIERIADGDTVMLWGYRRNCCDFEFDVFQSSYLDYVPLILCTYPKDTLPSHNFQSNGKDCVLIHLLDIDTADYIANHTTSDIWKVIAVVRFRRYDDRDALWCDCYNNYYSIPQQS